jgi:hypothetical protein
MFHFVKRYIQKTLLQDKFDIAMKNWKRNVERNKLKLPQKSFSFS